MKQGPLLCSDHLSDPPPPMWRLVAEADQQPSLAPPGLHQHQNSGSRRFLILDSSDKLCVDTNLFHGFNPVHLIIQLNTICEQSYTQHVLPLEAQSQAHNRTCWHQGCSRAGAEAKGCLLLWHLKWHRFNGRPLPWWRNVQHWNNYLWQV